MLDACVFYFGREIRQPGCSPTWQSTFLNVTERVWKLFAARCCPASRDIAAVNFQTRSGLTCHFCNYICCRIFHLFGSLFYPYQQDTEQYSYLQAFFCTLRTLAAYHWYICTFQDLNKADHTFFLCIQKVGCSFWMTKLKCHIFYNLFELQTCFFWNL